MFKIAAAVLAGVIGSGCVAADPDTIKPMSISTMGYAQADCTSLAAEDQRVADRLFRLTVLQGQQRRTDMVGVVLVGVSPTGVGTPEHAAEISRLKGERETISAVKVTKACSEPAAAADEERIRGELAKESAARRAEAEAKALASR